MLSLLFILSLAFSYAQAQTAVVTAVADPNSIRLFGVLRNFIENSLSAAGLKLSVDTNGQYNAEAQLDSAAFKIIAGGSVNKQLALGFAALSATANVDWTPASNGTSGSAIYSISGAWAELMCGLSTIFLWQNRDGKDGFQYNLGDNQFDCSLNNGLDCVIAGSPIDLAKDLTYTQLAINPQSCNLPADQGYNSNCTIWSISSTGQWQDLTSTTAVFTVTLTFASQKLQWNGNTIGPDYGKISYQISYPYAKKSQSTTGANVAVVAYIGGRAGTAGILGGTFQGKQAYIWAADPTKAAVLAWDGVGQLDGVNADIYVNGISGTAIAKFDCSACDLVSRLIIAGWQIAVAVASLGGWTSELVILSWTGEGPTTVYYDPVMGMASSSDYTTNTSGGLFLMPSFLTMMACFVFYRFFSR